MWDITSVCEVEARKHCSENLVCSNPLGLSSCSSIFQDRVSTSEPYCLCSYKRKFVQCIWQWHHIRPGKSWFRLKNIYSTRILCSLWTRRPITFLEMCLWIFFFPFCFSWLQIITFLQQNSHPRCADRVPSIPENVTDQVYTLYSLLPSRVI